MLPNLKIICQFHAHSVHQNSVDIFWAEIYRGRLLTLITESGSRLLRIRFSADLTMYWFPVCHFRCMRFNPLVIWIWNQKIAISTIVGTSSHIMNKLYVARKILVCNIKTHWWSFVNSPLRDKNMSKVRMAQLCNLKVLVKEKGRVTKNKKPV